MNNEGSYESLSKKDLKEAKKLCPPNIETREVLQGLVKFWSKKSNRRDSLEKRLVIKAMLKEWKRTLSNS